MGTRARGDHDSPYMRQWHPKRSDTHRLRRTDEHSERSDASDPIPTSPDRTAPSDRRRTSRAVRRAILALLVVITAGAAYASNRTARTQMRVYPATPRAWLVAYLSAVDDNPSRVCRMLLAPELAARYGHTGRRSCAASFSTAKGLRVRIRRIVQAKTAAVIELRETHPTNGWDFVLARQVGGWQAVELIRGH